MRIRTQLRPSPASPVPPRHLAPAPATVRCLTALLAVVACAPVTAVTPVYARQSSDGGGGGILPKGPLPVRNPEPTNTPFLLPTPVDASVLGREKSRAELNLDVPNHLLVVPQIGYTTDFEEQRLYLNYARGLGGGQELGIRLPYIWRNGGRMDWFIDWWHKSFRMGGGGRELLPRQRTVFVVRDVSGNVVIQDSRAREGLGDVVLEYRRSLTGNGTESLTGDDPRRIAASARALLKLPTGDSDYLFGSGATDFGLGIAVSARPARRIAVHGNLSHVWAGRSNNENFDHRSTFVHSVLSIEWMMDGRTSFVVQTDDNPAPHRTGYYYTDRARRSFTFGFWRTLKPGAMAYLSLGENDFGFVAKQAPDVTLSAGTRFLF
jgi:hypothetical protein